MSAAIHSLTNADISKHYRSVEVHMMRKAFTGPFARWVVEQSPYEVPDITAALKGFNDYVTELMGGEIVKAFSYDELSEAISAEAFEKIPAVLALNVAKISSGRDWECRYRNDNTRQNPDFDFISLGALGRNIFYSIVRTHINWSTDHEERAA